LMMPSSIPANRMSASPVVNENNIQPKYLNTPDSSQPIAKKEPSQRVQTHTVLPSTPGVKLKITFSFVAECANELECLSVVSPNSVVKCLQERLKVHH
jgi:hypothetical protein